MRRRMPGALSTNTAEVERIDEAGKAGDLAEAERAVTHHLHGRGETQVDEVVDRRSPRDGTKSAMQVSLAHIQLGRQDRNSDRLRVMAAKISRRAVDEFGFTHGGRCFVMEALEATKGLSAKSIQLGSAGAVAPLPQQPDRFDNRAQLDAVNATRRIELWQGRSAKADP